MLNLIPMVFLGKLWEQKQTDGQADDWILSSLDVKDAFLQVAQEHAIKVTLYGRDFAIAKNLPGQRLGARAWYWHFRRFLTDRLGFTWCPTQPWFGQM